MFIYHTIYTNMYKKEMNHYENDLEFQWVSQGFKNIFWLKVKINIQIFIQ